MSMSHWTPLSFAACRSVCSAERYFIAIALDSQDETPERDGQNALQGTLGDAHYALRSTCVRSTRRTLTWLKARLVLSSALIQHPILHFGR